MNKYDLCYRFLITPWHLVGVEKILADSSHGTKFDQDVLNFVSRKNKETFKRCFVFYWYINYIKICKISITLRGNYFYIDLPIFKGTILFIYSFLTIHRV